MIANICIIIGNGRSLQDVPLQWLDKYPTYGCNYINRLPYQPTYYVCIDKPLLERRADEIIPTIEAAKIAYISNYPAQTPAMTRIRSMRNVVMLDRYTLALDGETCMSGHTCSYVALKAAYYAGFERALLVGVDHNDGHFVDDYPPGNPTNFEGQRYHYRIARDAYLRAGKQIINLSPRSKLDEIFERGEMADY